MDNRTVSLLRRGQIEKIVVPPGDRAEQLIANLLLSFIASELRSHETAKAYIAEAYAIARGLADQYLTYRPPRPSKFARLTGELGTKTEISLFSIINEILVLPEFNFDTIANDQLVFPPPTISVINLEVVYFMLRLRTRKVLIALEALKKVAAGERLADAVRDILGECLYHEIPSAEPLDRAGDYFGLARNLIGKANFPLAALALKNADSALDLYMKATSIEHHPAVVQTMKDQIKQLLGEMRHTAM